MTEMEGALARSVRGRLRRLLQVDSQSDPTPEGKNHFELVNQCVRSGVPLWSSNGKPFRYRISPQRLTLLRYLEIGVWDRATRMRFYEPMLQNYPSRSLSLFKDSGRFDAVDVKVILVEYDEVYHTRSSSRAHLFRIRDSTRRLIGAGDRCVSDSSMTAPSQDR